MRKSKQLVFHEFLEDARGNFNVFTLISLWSGITLVTSPLVIRLFNWASLSKDEIYSLTLIYCISALGDYLLGIFLNKMPDVVNQIGGQNILGGSNNLTDIPNPLQDEKSTQLPTATDPFAGVK